MGENKEFMKESKEYVSVSTRLPLTDAVFLKLVCHKKEIAPSEYIRDLIKKSMHSPKNHFVAGKNIIRYNKTNNSFLWYVQLDSGEEIEVLKNISLDFLKSIDLQIQEAIKYRNEWIHQGKQDSVDIPVELVGEKNE